MKLQLIKLAEEAGFESDYIKYVSKTFSNPINELLENKDWCYLWMCELQKWFREEKRIHISSDVSPTSGNYEWFAHLLIDHNKVVDNYAPLIIESNGYDYVEFSDSLERGLIEVLKQLKDIQDNLEDLES